MTIRVACTAILKRIVAGTLNKDGLSLRGGGQDVTSDVLGAIIDYVGIDKTHVVTQNGIPMYEIEVRKVKPSST